MTDYSATLGFGVSLAFTPGSGAGIGVAVNLDAIHTLTPPNRNAPVVKWTPLDGSEAGNEQGVAGKKEITECSMQVTYTKARYSALEALFRIPGTYVLTLNDGSIMTAALAVMTKIAMGQLTDSAIQVIDMSFNVPAGWVTTAGTIANLTQAMTAGAATVDVTASPISGTGKKIVALTLLAPATNANQVTVAKGASSGCDNLGAHFTATLAPGQQITVLGDAAATAISSGNKNLDITGTLLQSIQISVLMV